VSLREQLNWFERLPLFGQRIIVTRSRSQAPELVDRLALLGAEVLQIPCIKTIPPSDLEPIKEAILGLHEYDWLVFTSVNGVRYFFEYFDKGFDDARDIGGVRIAAVGPATAKALKDKRLAVDVIPKEATGAQVAKAMMTDGDVENLRICLLRAENAGEELPALLLEKGAIVDDIPVYQTVADTSGPSQDFGLLRDNGADWITFTSGSTVDHFHARSPLPDLLRQFPNMKLASIGPETTKRLEALELQPTVEAREHTLEGLIDAVVKQVRKTQRKG
jgi:uroporphyrinogen III methyltransferase/synthase